MRIFDGATLGTVAISGLADSVQARPDGRTRSWPAGE